MPTDSLLVQTMASCHSLIKIDGELTGYPMDIKLFEAIEWVSYKKSINKEIALNELLFMFYNFKYV